MDCSCHEHLRKPQLEDEFHKVVPGLSPSSRILRTLAAVVLDKPGYACPYIILYVTHRPWSVRIGKNCARGLEYGPRPAASGRI